MFNYKNSIAYFRGEFVDFKEANLSIASSPVLYGLTVYTVLNACWNSKNKKLYVFRLKDHYQRLVNSAKIMGFNNFVADTTYKQFEEMITRLLRKNNVQEDVLVRVSVFIDELIAGTRIHDLKNNLSAYVYPMGKFYPAEGIHVCVSSWIRTPDNSQPSRAKINGSYVNASLMKNEALLNGYDEAIALDQHGHVAEGTVANLFIVRSGMLLTPDNSTDILEGITRNTVIHLAQELGITTKLCTVDRSELYIADEVFMCGSSARITPVLSVDKRPVANGKAGPLTKQLATLYSDIQYGRHRAKEFWLTEA